MAGIVGGIVADLQEDNRKLREAIEPFAKLADTISAGWADNRKLVSLTMPKLGDLTVGQVRKAAQALQADAIV